MENVQDEASANENRRGKRKKGKPLCRRRKTYLEDQLQELETNYRNKNVSFYLEEKKKGGKIETIF